MQPSGYLLADASIFPIPHTIAQHGKSHLRTRHAGFIDGIEQFDASLFGIAGAEAELMDPQHRLLMEVSCWNSRKECCVVHML